MESEPRPNAATVVFAASCLKGALDQRQAMLLRSKTALRRRAQELMENSLHLADKIALEQNALFRQEYVDEIYPVLQEALDQSHVPLFEDMGLTFGAVTLAHIDPALIASVDLSRFSGDIRALFKELPFSESLHEFFENLGALGELAKRVG